MHHKMTIRDAPEFPSRPFFANCSCGPQGNFFKKEDAQKYLEFHRQQVGGGFGVTVEFSDETQVPTEVEQAQTLGDA